jgi:hypothetical protein
MVFALIVIVAIAFGFLVSPLIAGVIFIVGAVGYLVLYGLGRRPEESPSAGGTEAHTAARMRRDARNTRIR